MLKLGILLGFGIHVDITMKKDRVAFASLISLHALLNLDQVYLMWMDSPTPCSMKLLCSYMWIFIFGMHTRINVELVKDVMFC
jgi:hypothetical protein